MSFFRGQSAAALTVIILLAACGGGAKIPRLSGESGQNLLVITLDTTRADRIGAYGYKKAETPNIDSLARSGALFANAYASVPLTLPSHATIFTGRDPFVHGVRNNGTYALPAKEDTLAEAMKGRGLKTFAVVASFVLHSKFGLNQGFDLYDDALDYSVPAGNLHTEIDASRVYARFRSWLEERGVEEFFAWVHFFDPHMPYDPPAEFKKRFPEDPYDGEIACVDTFIGKIVEDLRLKNLLDRTLIVIAGDHGEAFGEHEELGHGIFCYDEGLRVPLIFSHPSLFGSGGRVVQEAVRLADVAPTVLDLFGMDVPKDIQGRSLAPLLAGRKTPSPPIYFESLYGQEDMGWAPLTGLIHRGNKFIALPEPELYDLEKDPHEKNNLFTGKTDLAREMDAALRNYIQDRISAGPSAGREMTAADKEKLETLGYLSAFSPKSKTALDPKVGIGRLNDMLSVKKLFDEGRAEDAEKRLLELRRTRPDLLLPQFFDNLANFYKDRGELEKAAGIMEEAAERFPDQERFRMNLALFRFGLGKIEETEDLCRSLIKVNPGLAQAHSLLGTILKARGDLDGAAASFGEAAEAEPMNIMLRLDYAQAELARGNRDDALRIINSLRQYKILMDDPQAAGVRSQIGILLAEAGDIDGAAELLQRIIDRGEATAAVWTHLGLCFFEKGDWDKAGESYGRALEIDPKDALALSGMGTLSLSRFRRENNRALHAKAVDYYERALKADPLLASAYNGLAIALRIAGQNEKAVALLKKAVEARPDFTNAYINLGIVLLDLGRTTEALGILEACRDKYLSRMSESDRRQLQGLIERARKPSSS